MTEIKQFYKSKNLFANNNIPTMHDILEDIAQCRLAKEQRKQARQQKREDTKKEINELAMRNYYNTKESYRCDCGSTINISSKPQHIKSKKHINKNI